MKTATHLVVFDVDGTLIDSQDVICQGMTEAFRSEGLSPPPREEILSIVGLSLPLAIATLAPDQDADTIGRMTAAYKDSFIALRKQTGGERAAPLYPGALAALESLHGLDHLCMGVATGKARRGLDHTLDGHGLRGYFVTSQTADDHPSKPHPSMLQRAAVETGIDAARAVMIGDTEFDIAMGRAAGFSTIAVSWGYHPVDRLRSAGADHVIDDFAALAPLLDRLWGAA